MTAPAGSRYARVAVWLVFAALWLWLDVAIPWRHLAATAGDFRAYHQAARALAAGESPYSEAAFIYPPLLPLMMLPLASLPLDTARVVWFVASQAALLGSLWLMLSLLGNSFAALAAVLLVWTVGGTVQENLVLGQVNPFLLLAIVAAMRLLPRRPNTAATVIGAVAALKVWPAVLLVLFAWRRAWRPLVAGVAVTLALLAVPAAITAAMVEGPIAVGGDLATVGARELRVGTAAPLNVSLPALALRVADRPSGGLMPASWIEGVSPGGFEPWRRHGWIAAAVAAMVLAGSVVALSGPRPRSILATHGLESATGSQDARFSWAFDLGALVAAAILAAPIGWYHYQLCQFPAFAILLEQRLTARRYRAAGAIVIVLAALTRAPSWSFGGYVERFGWTAQAPAWLWIATGVGPIVGVAWTVFLIREARRRRTRREVSSA